MYIHNLRLNQNHPQVDIYVHTVITPVHSAQRTAATSSNTNTSNTENLFLNLLNNSRLNTNNNATALDNSHNNASNFRLENPSNLTLNSISPNNNILDNNQSNEQNNTFLSHKREGDELEEPTTEQRNISQDISNSQANMHSAENVNNVNMEDIVNRERVNSESSYDIIVEEFYENEHNNHSNNESD